MTALDAQSVARALGGEVAGRDAVLAPGPGHSPADRSLSIKLGADNPDGFLIHSFSGDDPIACRDYVRERLGLPRFEPGASNGTDGGRRGERRIVATYRYHDAAGELLFEVVRFTPKDFRQRRPDGAGGWHWNVRDVEVVPYRLPEVIEAIALDRAVLVVEGERDADRLHELGAPATCNAGGAGKWRAEYAKWFVGADVIILPDNDPPGRAHAQTVARSLAAVSARVRVVHLPGLLPKGDASDWLDAGGTLEGLHELIAATPDWQEDDGDATEAVPVSLPVVDAASLADKPVPPRAWHVDELIPAATVTLLGGDGGTGKSLIALQLAVATTIGSTWLNRHPRRGPVLFVTGEDDLDEVHRRLAAIAASEDVGLAALAGLGISSLAGADAMLALPEGRGAALKPTPLFGELEAKVEAARPALLVLDTLADLFGGEENQRAHARQFVSLLRGLAIRCRTTVLLLAHPSLNGMATGSGYSGSTAWNNSVRSRLYLERAKPADGDEEDPDLRVLRTLKANYGRTGAEIRIRWRAGVFSTEAAAGVSFDQAAAEARAERIFLNRLAAYQADDRRVSASPSPNYAPTVFALDPRSEGIGKAALVRAMNRLFEAGKLRKVEEGPPSRRRSYILPVEG